ncbi:MAG: HAD hydrolase-like protein [Lachnospiraceae bacterium]|nr:HAD hydrolase-like protein [Lachnospiraceae bacterium]
MTLELERYKLIIADMDGTLYYQKPVRAAMGLKLFCAVLKGGARGLKELVIIYRYRKIREEEDLKQDLICERLAKRYGMSPGDVRKIAVRWLQEIPLSVLPAHRDRVLCEKLLDLKARGRDVAVYSDYPASDKCRALGLSDIPSWHSDMADIGEMKPSPKGIRYLMDRYGVTDPGEVLVIGDRESRDGGSADAAGTDKLILPRDKKMRTRLYGKLGLL